MSDKWKLKNIETGEIIPITKSVFKVGRNVNAEIVSESNVLSRNHALLSILIDGLYVQDNKSMNGTFVNGHKIEPMEMQKLKAGDIVGFGGDSKTTKIGVQTPFIFEIVTKDPVQRVPATSTVKKSFCTISDLIVISDDDDDDSIVNSQIFHITESIKKEHSSQHENVFDDIKKELSDLDYCNKEIEVDLTDEFEVCQNTIDLLNILESSADSNLPQASENNSVETNLNKTGSTGRDKETNDELSTTCSKDSSSNDDSPEECRKEKTIMNANNKRKDRRSIGECELTIETSVDDKGQNSNARSSKRTKQTRNVESLKEDVTSTENLIIELSDDESRNKNIPKSKRKTISSKGPVIIEPHVIQLKTRKTPENKVENKGKRKNVKHPVAVKKLKTDPKVPPSTVNSTEKRTLANTRLKSLTGNDRDHVDKVSLSKKTNPKVKVSDSRGQFLLESVNAPSTSTRKSPRKLPKPRTSTTIEKPVVTSNSNKKADAKPKTVLKDSAHNQSVVVDLTYSLSKDHFNHFIAPQNATVIRKYDCDNVNSEIGQIVEWPIQWLVEQTNMDISPPVCKGMTPRSIPNVFKDFKEYYSVMRPLVFLELWQHTFQSVSSIRDGAREPLMVKVVHERRVDTICYLDCECTMNENNSKTFIRPEDLAIVELKLKDTKLSYKFVGFGFIKTSGKLNRNDGLNPAYNFGFTILLRSFEEKQRFDNNLLLQVFTNIGNSLRLFRAMNHLSSSAVCNKVLDPNVGILKLDSCGPALSGVKLNREQQQVALEVSNFCLGHDNGFYLLRGPPGTGKSTVIVSIIFEMLFKSQKNTGIQPLILLTAPSNAAIDCLIMKIAEYRSSLSEQQRRCLRMIRTGPEASISKSVDKFKLTYFAQKDVLVQSQLQHTLEFKNWIGNGGDLNGFLKNQLKHEYYYKVKNAEEKILLGSNVICTTLNSCVSVRLLHQTRRGQLKFTCCIIDEATQCTELESLLPVQLGIEKFVLVGDPQQLPAVVCNKDAQNCGLDKSLFARIDDSLKSNKNAQVRMLYDQYRMKAEICEYPNKAFYEGKLRSHPVSSNVLQPSVKPYLLFNLKTENADPSEYVNQQEVTLISLLLQNLSSTVKTKNYTIGIITPYKAQKELLKRSIINIKFQSEVTITVNTVDSFQGMENDIIIISCVRYNPNSFLENEKRLNVALTRARQGLYVIGNYSLFKLSRPLYDLREDAKKRHLCFDINIKTVKSLHKFIFK